MFDSFRTTSIDGTPDNEAGDAPGTRHLTVIGLVLAVLVASLGWLGARAALGDDEAGLECEVATVELVVAPAMADLAAEAVASLPSNECVELEVSTATVADIIAAQDEVDEGEDDALPNLWMPDSPAWRSVVIKAELSASVVVPALATTPVAFGGGVPGSAGVNWLAALTNRKLAIVDPNANGASAMTLVAPYADGDPDAATRDMVAVAQEFGSKILADRVGRITADTIAAGSRKLVPVTEQEFLIAQRGNPTLTWRAPATGVPLLSYPLVQVTENHFDLGIGTGTVDVAKRVGEDLADWFGTDAAKDAIADEQLRGPDGAPLADDQSISSEKLLPSVAQNQIDATMKNWNYLVVPSSVLALIEASDSMDTPFGSTTRIGLTVDVAKVSLDAFPDGARLGSWAFSTNRGPHGEDWQEMVPLRRIDAPLGEGRTHRDAILETTTVTPQTYGGSGLYDSILAAYEEASRQYNPAYYNAIVVYTDGPNEDPNSITLNQLIERIEALYDPDRQVQIIPIGLTGGADMASLGRIAGTTDALAYAVLQASDIYTVLTGALLARE